MIFSRPEASYDLREELFEQVLEDFPPPLSCIARQIQSGNKVLDIGAKKNSLIASILKQKSQDSVIDGIESNVYASTIQYCLQKFLERLFRG